MNCQGKGICKQQQKKFSDNCHRTHLGVFICRENVTMDKTTEKTERKKESK